MALGLTDSSKGSVTMRVSSRRFVGFAVAVVVSLAMSGARASADNSSAIPSAFGGPDTQGQASDGEIAVATAKALNRPVEDESQRTETTKVSANPDGTWTAETASEPVRVQDAEGEWHDIDTRLVEKNGHLEPRFSTVDLAFSDGGEKTFATLSEADHDVSLQWPSVLPEPAVDGDTAIYHDVVDGGDLVVRALPGGFSHSIVFNERPSEPVEVSLPVGVDGTTLVESQATGELAFKSDGETIVSAPRPMMWDSSVDEAGSPDNTAPVDTEVAHTESGKTRLILSPNDAFFADPETVYPVTVDPTFSPYTTGDTWIMNADFSGSQYWSQELRAGTYDGGGHLARSLMTFDVAALKGKVLDDATLRLRNWDAGSCTAGALRAYQVTSNWSLTGVNWANQPTVSTTGYADYEPAHGASAGCAEDNAYWDVKQIVQRWTKVTDADPNYGFRVRGASETSSNTWRKYRSAEYTANPVYAPRLITTYRSYPETPTDLSVSPSISGVVSTLAPTLAARVSDPDGGSVRAGFRLYSGPIQIWSGDGSDVTSGDNSTTSLPAGLLAPGQSYTLKAYGFDGQLLSGLNGTAGGFASVDFTVSPDAGGLFVSSPGRVLDTSAAPAIGDYATPMPAQTWRSVQLLGRGGIPSTGVLGVALSITAVSPNTAGGIDISLNSSSNGMKYVAYRAGGSTTSSAFVGVGTTGTIRVRTSTQTHLRIDVLGYYVAQRNGSTSYLSVVESRLLDSASGMGIAQAKLAPGNTAAIQAAGVGDVESNATAVLARLTLANATGNGLVKPYAADGSPLTGGIAFGPTSSTVTTLLPLSATGATPGAFKLNVSGASTDVAVDILGFYAPGYDFGAFTAAQARLLDTRISPEVQLAAGATRTVQVTGIAGVPANTAVGTLRLEVVGTPATAGTITVWADGEDEPTSSSLGYVSNGPSSGLVVSNLSSDGKVKVHNAGTSAIDVTVDIESSLTIPATPSEDASAALPGDHIDAQGTISNDGVPLEGAEIQALVWPTAEILEDLPAGESLPLAALDASVTDASGHFELEGSTDDLGPEYVNADGSVEVQIQASDSEVMVPYTTTIEPEPEVGSSQPGTGQGYVQGPADSVSIDLATGRAVDDSLEMEDLESDLEGEVSEQEFVDATTSILVPESELQSAQGQSVPNSVPAPSYCIATATDAWYPNMLERFVSIYNWDGALADLTQRDGVIHNIGIGGKLNGGSTWGQVGALKVTTTTSEEDAVIETAPNSKNRTWFNRVKFRDFKVTCPNRMPVVERRAVRITSFYDHSEASVAQNWTKSCLNKTPRNITISNTKAYTKQAGVDFFGVFNLTAQSGYTTESSITYKVRKNSKICTNDAYKTYMEGARGVRVFPLG